MTKNIDEILREAIEQGKFKDLPNKGKKLDLDPYFDTPEDLRVGYSVLKSADFVPEEVQLLKEIGEMQASLEGMQDEARRKDTLKKIENARLKYNLLAERFKRHKPGG